MLWFLAYYFVLLVAEAMLLKAIIWTIYHFFVALVKYRFKFSSILFNLVFSVGSFAVFYFYWDWIDRMYEVNPNDSTATIFAVFGVLIAAIIARRELVTVFGITKGQWSTSITPFYNNDVVLRSSGSSDDDDERRRKRRKERRRREERDSSRTFWYEAAMYNDQYN